MRVVSLKAEYLDRPLGVENRRPRLSWRLECSERKVRQSAYRIWVASTEAALHTGRGDLWDSGQVTSHQSFGIEYQGRPLGSRQRCWWAVQVWDERGEPSAMSIASWWEMGLLEREDWSAQWLAVEDAVAQADREFGLHWIWGTEGSDGRPRRFRLRFRLSVASRNGVLLTVANATLGDVRGVWIDGCSLASAESGGPSGQLLEVPPLDAGEHVLAVEVSPIPPSVFASARAVLAHGMTLFGRIHLQGGEVLRIGSGPDCRTSLIDDAHWFALAYDDTGWEAARHVPPPSEGYQPWPTSPAMYIRREFSLDKPLVQARLYATALGAYEARLNGRRVGDAQLTPEPSQYAKRALYRVYDVTDMLCQGKNAFALIVGDGFYASSDGRYAWAPPPRRVLAQLELTLVDGARVIIGTGPGWRDAQSPIQASEMKVGEVYDARLDQPGWDRANFDDSHWQVARMAERPACKVVAQISPPIRIMEVLKPQRIAEPRPGVYVFDFGEHFAGWCRLHVQGERDSRIELRFAELLAPSGEVDQHLWSIGAPKRDVFILQGTSCGETFEPRFTYRGFRYVQVSGLPRAPDASTLEGCFVHSDLEVTGRLRIEHALIQQIWRNTVRTQRSNFVGIPTDCPSREQRGFMADASIFWDAAAFNLDVCAFTSRQMDNVADDQAADGAFPMYSPMSRKMADWLRGGSPPVWGDGSVVLPWTAWQRYGDRGVVTRHWQAMNRYVEYILSRNPDHIWKNGRDCDFGDWLAVDQVQHDPSVAPTTLRELISTAYWAHSVALLAQMAHALGQSQDAERLRALFGCIRRAFVDEFVKGDGTVGNGSQASYVLALKFGLLPEQCRASAAAHLVADISKRGNALSTGIVGTQFILDVLADAGYADVAYSLLLRREYPSWGYMIEQGATTIWETWSGELEEGGKQSQNHFAFGSICGFLFRRVAGIDAATPGFETILIRPVLDSRVQRAGADYDSVMGRISTDWAVHPDGGFTLDVTIPANATARIHLPAMHGSRIEESGQELGRGKDVHLLRRLDHEAVVEVGSGSYRFAVSRHKRRSEGEVAATAWLAGS